MKKRINITLEKRLFEKSKQNADKLGISFSAYIALSLAKENKKNE